MSRLTEGDIDRQMSEKMAAKMATAYTGYIPTDFIRIFMRAVMAMPPNDHQIRVVSLQAISQKKQEDLTWGEVGGMQNVIVRVALHRLYPDLVTMEALAAFEGVEKLVLEYNQDLTLFKKQVERERRALLDLLDVGSRKIKIVR